MKANKASCFVLLVIALIFAIIGAVVLLLPKEVSPVTVSDTPIVRKSGGYITVYFTLENESDKDVEITYIEFKITTNNETEIWQVNENMTLAAGESSKLTYKDTSYNSPNKITEISIRIDGKKYYVYEVSSTSDTVAVVCFIFAIVFGILAVCCFVGVLKQEKRYQSIKQEINDKFAGNAIFAVGCYGKKGESGKAAAKTAASVAGGAVFAVLFGFGTYKIYGANAPKEFVISDDGLYVGDPLKKGFDLGGMNYMEKGSFNQTEIKVKKKQVTLNNLSSQEFFMFDLSGNKEVTPEQLVEKLNNLVAPIENLVAGSSAVNTETKEDPFDI